MPRLFTVAVDEDEPKCGGCNWRVGRLYALAETQEEAAALYQSGDAGLCGDCIADLITEDARIVLKPFAYTAVLSEDNYRVGRAEMGTRGYTPCAEYGMFRSYDTAKEKADELNRALRLDPAEAWRIVATTMRQKETIWS